MAASYGSGTLGLSLFVAARPIPRRGWDRGRGRRGLRWWTRRAGGFRPHLRVDLTRQAGILSQKVAHVLTTLAEAHVAVRHPGAALLHDPELDSGVNQGALSRDALVEQDVELGIAERRRDLVLDDLDLHTVANAV